MTGRSTGARIIAASSGKGGMGKTFLAANLGFVLSQTGNRVTLLDADLGLANLDIMMDLKPQATLHEVLVGERELNEVALIGPGGIRVIPAASGKAEYAQITHGLQEPFEELIRRLTSNFDFLILDTAAGISDVVLYSCSLAHEIIIVTTPEPTALTDAYAIIKLMTLRYRRSSFQLIVNQADSETEGEKFFSHLQTIAGRFLVCPPAYPVRLSHLGTISRDAGVARSIIERRLLCTSNSHGPAARQIQAIGRRISSVARRPGEAALARDLN